MVTFVVVDNLNVDDDIVEMVKVMKSFLSVDFSYFQKQFRANNVLFVDYAGFDVARDNQLTDLFDFD